MAASGIILITSVPHDSICNNAYSLLTCLSAFPLGLSQGCDLGLAHPFFISSA